MTCYVKSRQIKDGKTLIQVYSDYSTKEIAEIAMNILKELPENKGKEFFIDNQFLTIV